MIDFVKSDWESMWRRIVALQGETFRQKRGKPFTYRVYGGAVHPSTTYRMLPRSHFEKASRLMPLDGPGRIQHLQAPSYIWAILNDSRIFGDSATESEKSDTSTPDPQILTSPQDAAVPGTKVTAEDLVALGFKPLELDVLDEVELPFGQIGVIWKTIGEVPDSAGIYAFTVADRSDLRVTYVGMTKHLWMVTKGRLPGGGARGGQRYGRPKHAGVTRQRINIEIANQLRAGRTVQHWIRPTPDSSELVSLEADLIKRWNLRLAGWNRG